MTNGKDDYSDHSRNNYNNRSCNKPEEDVATIYATTDATTGKTIDATATSELGGRNDQLGNSNVGTSATEETLSMIVMKAVKMLK